MTLKMDTTEVVSSKSMGVKQEGNQDEQDPQMDIKVKGRKSTVTVSWDKKKKKRGLKDVENGSKTRGRMMDSAGATKGALKTKAKTKKRPSKAATLEITDEPCPSKTPKLINDGLCLFIGNLNNAKDSEEVSVTLAKFFMTKGVLAQDIRVDRARKHAHIDVASEFDLKKALTFDGEELLGRPMKICKAKVKREKVAKKLTAEEKRALKDGRCVFLKNIPHTATKDDILKLFRKAVNIRFPGGTDIAGKGIAFVEFRNKVLAKKVLMKKRLVKIQGQILIVDPVGKVDKADDEVGEADDEVNESDDEVDKADDEGDDKNNADENNADAKAPVPSSSTLFVSNLPFTTNERMLRDIFQKAVNIMLPKKNGKSKGYAFVTFSTVTDAKKALKANRNKMLSKRPMRVQFNEKQDNIGEILPNTLIVKGLCKKTTAETLQAAFEGALSARVAVDKETKVSKGFGFVEFESEEKCRAAKEAMEDCEIDGCQVNVDHALSNTKKHPGGGKQSSAVEDEGKKPAEQADACSKRSKRGKRKRGKPQDTDKDVENKS